ncbi:MAG: hypothetical protein QM766_03565 [Burkholderiaceae bacterium]
MRNPLETFSIRSPFAIVTLFALIVTSTAFVLEDLFWFTAISSYFFYSIYIALAPIPEEAKKWTWLNSRNFQLIAFSILILMSYMTSSILLATLALTHLHRLIHRWMRVTPI